MKIYVVYYKSLSTAGGLHLRCEPAWTTDIIAILIEVEISVPAPISDEPGGELSSFGGMPHNNCTVLP